MNQVQKEVQLCTNEYPADAPTICRCCKGDLEKKFQPALIPGRAGYWYLTCWNPCALHGYTFTNNTYPTVDLTPYLEKATTK